jgi:hypothetical protein
MKMELAFNCQGGKINMDNISKYKDLAINNPTLLVKLIEDGSLDAVQLTYAAESMSLTRESSIVVPCLIKLLENTSSLVREGAVYGLEGHLEYRGVINCLKNTSENDSAEGIREAALEALE